MTDIRVLEIDYTTPPANGEVATYNSTTGIWEPAAGGGGGGITIEQAQDSIGTILLDTAEIAFVYDDATPNISANLRNSSIDETRLDASVNASLDLADSALQAAAIGVTVQAYSAVLAATTASFTTTDETKLDAITGTNTGDQTSIVGISGTMAEFNTAVSDGNILFNDEQGLGFRFENRTSDPGTPTVGQVWLRTDL